MHVCTYAYTKTHTYGCAEPQIHKRPNVTFLTFLLSCNLSCRICLVTVIFCCHGAYAFPSPAPLESSKHKLNEKSGISYIPHLKGAQKQAEIMLRKNNTQVLAAKNPGILNTDLKGICKRQSPVSSAFVIKLSISIQRLIHTTQR